MHAGLGSPSHVRDNLVLRLIADVSEDPLHPWSASILTLIPVYPAKILRLCRCVALQVLPEFTFFSDAESLKVSRGSVIKGLGGGDEHLTFDSSKIKKAELRLKFIVLYMTTHRARPLTGPSALTHFRIF